MHQPQLLHLQQAREHLLRDGANVFELERLELVRLEIVVEVDLEQFEHDADVVAVLEALVCPHEVVVVRRNSAQSREDVDFDLPLFGVRRYVFQNLHRDDLVGVFLPRFHHLAERASPEEVNYLVDAVRGGYKFMEVDAVVPGGFRGGRLYFGWHPRASRVPQ